MDDKRYILGFILIAFSFIACVISYWVIVFALPFYVIGAVLVFLSRRTSKMKVLSTVLPLILWFPATYIFLTLYNYTPPKTILIPADYEGRLRIVYNERCGIEPTKENGRQIIEFDSSGLLILKSEFDGGLNNKYYLVDTKGNRTKANQILAFDDIRNNMPAILVAGAGTMTGTIKANSDNHKTKGITFSDFYLYNRDSLSRENHIAELKFNEFTDSLVSECRKEKKAAANNKK